MLSRKIFLLVTAVLFLLTTVPVSAHNLPIGGSRWCFGKNNIVGNIDMKPPLLMEIKGIKEGNYNLYSVSDEQLQQIVANIIQPYINQKLTIKVNNKACPLKVNRIVNNNGMFTIWLSADEVDFTNPDNPVNIDYRLLFEEDSAHVNLAYAYMSDATGAALQKIFDFSPPAFQTRFNANNQVWQFSIKGTVNASVAENKTTPAPVTSSKPDAAKKTAAKAAARKISADDSAKTARTRKDHPPAVSTVYPMPVPSSTSKAESSAVSLNTAKPSTWADIREFLGLGIEHILTGYDHIAFLLALIVIGLSIRDVLKIITAFTIAHSITLLLAALEIVRLNSRFVESVIAFSICYVALENLFKKKVNYRWLIAFGFGLVHGFGFASALQELIVGKSNLLVSVVSFNMGVEIGQLMIFFVMLPILHLLKKQFEARIITAGTSVAVFLIGFAWLIERVFTVQLLWF
jgi:hydrogenase/urease accessory protein HupE